MKRKVLIIFFIVIILLLIPLIFKDKSKTVLVGPDLSDLHYQEVSFTNEEDSIELAGMLFVPEGIGPFNVAVIGKKLGCRFLLLMVKMIRTAR